MPSEPMHAPFVLKGGVAKSMDETGSIADCSKSRKRAEPVDCHTWRGELVICAQTLRVHPALSFLMSEEPTSVRWWFFGR